MLAGNLFVALYPPASIVAGHADGDHLRSQWRLAPLG
jgi:hypothetical protein